MIDFERQGEIALLRLNRPEVHNSVNREMMEAWEDHLNRIEADACCRAILLTGAGNETFCAGGDLRYFASLRDEGACREMSLRMQRLLERLYFGKRVVIAAVNGQALGGGCEILTACHFRFAADHALFSFRQAPNGIITGWGGGRRLLGIVSRSRALRLFLGGEKIDAPEALRIHFVDRICPAGELLEEAAGFAQQILAHPPQAVEAFLTLAEQHQHLDWQEMSRLETDLFVKLWFGEPFQKVLAKYRREN